VIYLALRAYQLDHGGRTPDSLDALVPAELPAIPLDPCRAGPFGYMMGNASSEVRPLGQVLEPQFVNKGVTFEDATNRRLFYSVCGDRQDDHATIAFPSRERNGRGNIIFALPPEPGAKPTPSAGKPEIKLPDNACGP
jgi:hypothetical protein